MALQASLFNRINNSSYDPYSYSPDNTLGTMDFTGLRTPFISRSNFPDYFGSSNLQKRLFADPTGVGGPSTRTVEGQGIFTDLNANQVWDQGESYNPSSSIWNGWMSQQDAMQNPTTPTTAGIGSVPTTQEQQNYQNALTYADWSGDPLTAEEQSQYSSAAYPKHNWKTERAAGNDWLGDLF